MGQAFLGQAALGQQSVLGQQATTEQQPRNRSNRQCVRHATLRTALWVQHAILLVTHTTFATAFLTGVLRQHAASLSVAKTPITINANKTHAIRFILYLSNRKREN